MTLIDLVKSQVNIIDWADAHLDGVRRSGRGTAVACCPLHDDRSPSMSLSGDVGLWYCHGCKRGGNLAQLVAEMDDLSPHEAALSILAWAGYDGEAEIARLDRRDAALRRAIKISRDTPIPEQHRRGLSDISFAWAEIGYGSDPVFRDASAFDGDIRYACRNRITFPITDLRGNLVAIAGRKTDPRDESEPKYVFTRGFDKAVSWFRINGKALDCAPQGTVVVEGQFDALRVAFLLGPHTNVSVVALCGCVMSPQQAYELTRNKRVWLMFDGDAAGRSGAAKAWRQLRRAGLPDERNLVVSLLNGFDPDLFFATNKEVLPTLLRTATPMRIGEARAEIYREAARYATEGDHDRERALLEKLYKEEGLI